MMLQQSSLSVIPFLACPGIGTWREGSQRRYFTWVYFFVLLPCHAPHACMCSTVPSCAQAAVLLDDAVAEVAACRPPRQRRSRKAAKSAFTYELLLMEHEVCEQAMALGATSFIWSSCTACTLGVCLLYLCPPCHAVGEQWNAGRLRELRHWCGRFRWPPQVVQLCHGFFWLCAGPVCWAG